MLKLPKSTITGYGRFSMSIFVGRKKEIKRLGRLKELIDILSSLKEEDS